MSKKNPQEPPIKKNAFVHKLYSMLSDPKLSHLIWWTRNEESNTFALSPGKEFANALTGYFKHGNVASFVRQLHMYGFHKVSDPQSTDPNATNPSSSMIASSSKDNFPIWEFKHSSGKFKKNDESSLIYIKRRSSSNSSRNSVGYSNENDTSILIPTSSPSPNAFDNIHHHSFHFGQHPSAPPTAHHLHPSGYIQHGPHVYYGGPPPPGPSHPHATSTSPSGPFLPQNIPQPHHQVHHIPYATNQHTMPYAFTSNPVPLDQYQHQHQPQPHHIPHQPHLQHQHMHQNVQQIASGSPPNLQQHPLPPGSGSSQHHPHHSQGPSISYEQDKRSYSPAVLNTQYEPGLRQSSSYTSLHNAENQETSIQRHNSDPQRASMYPVGPQSSEQQQQHQTPTQSYGVTPGGTAIHAQHYTPSLQFRKIWETSNPSSRPRNPSLLFDPLAPAPHHGSTSAPSAHHTQPSYSPAPDAQASMKAPPRGASVSSPPPHAPTSSIQSQFQQHHQSQHQQQSMHAPPPPPAQLTGAVFISGRSDSASSFGSARDSIDSTRSSIKLPPPSSIHRVSSNLAFPPSPDIKGDEADPISGHASFSSSSEKTPANFTNKAKSTDPAANTSMSSSSSGTHATSIPGSPSSSFSKKPSLVPISSSIHERLRPSLIELHLGSGTTPGGSGSAPSSLPGSASAPSSNSYQSSLSSVSKLTGPGIMKLQSDSIGSHSSNNNSIFSNKSSVSSMSSAQRTSSFGSISFHPSVDVNKNSISIGPHDPIPPTSSMNGGSSISGMHAPETINEDEVANPSSAPINSDTAPPVQFPRPRSPSSLSSAPVAPRPKMFRSLTPPSKFQQKTQQIHSPIPRSSTSIAASHHHNNNHQPHFHSSLRSLTHSPLSQSVVNDGDTSSEASEKTEPSEETSKKRTNIINSIKAIKNKVSVDSLLGNNDNVKFSNVNSIINESSHDTDHDGGNETENEGKNAVVTEDDNKTTGSATIPTASEEKKIDQEIKRQRLE